MAKNTGLSKLEDRLAAILADRETRSQRRRLSTFPPHSVDFSSNSYLSLSLTPEIRQTYLELLKSVPDSTPLFGSGGSRLLDGNSPLSEDLEREVAAFHGAPTGLLFNSGFDANAGLFACLTQPGDVVVYDELAHASMHDGMRASRAALCVPFRHNCVYPEQVQRCQDSTTSKRKDGPKSLRETLHQLLGSDDEPLSAALRSGERNVFIAVEGVYSMDGDVAPLKDIVACIEHRLPRGNGYLIVDEAHSTGIFGDQGRGLVCELGLEDKVFLRLHTFGKAMGSAGAIVLCSPVTREYLINYARTLVYTTALPTSCLASIKVTYAFLSTPQFDDVRQKLRWLMRYTHSVLVAICARHTTQDDQPTSSDRLLIRVNPTPPTSPIIPLLTSQPRSLAAFCQQRGLVVRPIVAPTVPEGSERVRICLHAANTKEQVDRLGQAIEEWGVTTSRAAASGRPRDKAAGPSAAQQFLKPSL
ncbi:pyridoxal phosphate-dependent transferase [Microdochium trichocladiopsis]|uniref:Pyridoxal phosphate-dependent transferase n=1 Tax=Microdochium trichocladiopsis TaxID=1682393 RepID=A0A9P8XPY4_9PEZI|nr:pyridoxal phosphate-dependent transferase [Microdochium trichocladiopsis]KAH7009445.1 pyridoxal phosphate-dependent transferase [Microdochium trichocladiopsis]